MSEWADEVKRKIDSFNSRREEIDDALKALLEELKNPPYNLLVKCELIDKQNLIWSVKIGPQTFTISGQEISATQTNFEVDGFGNLVTKRKNLKEVLQSLILEKLKSF
nr:MAG: hypothetical protein DIU64_13695 [Caldicoprobacter oshimai]